MKKIRYILEKRDSDKPRYLVNMHNDWRIPVARERLTDIELKAMIFDSNKNAIDYMFRKGITGFRPRRIRLSVS